MTRDEYRELCNSDYWKGYSYAIVKERDWTCEDCGKKFQYERNKLNVHHLCYKGDNKPWQYEKSELKLLCGECHVKRHGIKTIKDEMNSMNQVENNIMPANSSTNNGDESDALEFIIPLLIFVGILIILTIIANVCYHNNTY